MGTTSPKILSSQPISKRFMYDLESINTSLNFKELYKKKIYQFTK